MKNILVFTDWFLPGYRAGGPIRSLANLTSQLQNEYNFFIVTRDTDYLQKTPYTSVTSNQWNTPPEISNLNVFYLSTKNISFRKIRSFFKPELYDIVYINGMFSLYFSILPVLYAKIFGMRHIIAPRGMLSQQAFSSKSLKKQLFFKLAGLWNLYKNARFHATMEKEALDIQKILNIPDKHISIAPNLPKKIIRNMPPIPEKIPGKLKLISIARISPEKNLLYALYRLKHITGGDIEFSIYGDIYDADYYTQCLKVIQGLPENVKVTYYGSIQSENIPEILQSVHVLLLPSKGENFGHSILESLSEATPVIISKSTPWQNLVSNKAGWDIKLENNNQFESVLEQCLDMKQDVYDQLANGAFNLARAFTGDKANIEKSRELFSDKIRQL